MTYNITKLPFDMQTIFKLAKLEKDCFGRDAWSINNLKGEFSNNYSHFFGVVDSEEIVGYVCVRIMFEEAQICNIAVANTHRRMGIATQLMQEVHGFSQLQGCERCELEVNTQNEPAVNLYKKVGYNVEGIRKNFYRRTRYESRDAYTMVRPLTEEDNK